MDDLLNKIDSRLGAIESHLSAQKDVLSLAEVSVYTGISKSYLYKLTCRNEIPYYKPNGKMIYFSKSEIDRWLLQNRSESKAEIESQAAEFLIKRNYK